MAININRSFMNNTGLNENNCLNNLVQSLSPDMENEIDMLNETRYYNNIDYRNLLQNTNSNITILNLNCLNLRTRFDNLKIFLADVDIEAQISCITLQGTCFTEHTDLNMYSIPGYTLVSEAYRISSHCGVAIYIHDDFSYERILTNNVSNMFEHLTIEMWQNSAICNKYLISSVYRPPTSLVEDLTIFIDEFTAFLGESEHRKAYICGDFNINLLKINENINYNIFYENVTSHGFIPQITLPTRLSDTCDTLIDNIFTNNIGKKHLNCIMSTIISDHQMTCCILPQINHQRNKNIYIEVENINENTLESFKNELNKLDVNNKIDHDINANPSDNYNILSDILCNIKQKCIPKKIRKFNKRKDKKEKWMTNELLTEINTKNDMYVDWKSNSTTDEIYNMKKTNFKTFERIVKNNIETTKRKYYFEIFKKYKNDMKNTWKTINETLSRHKREQKVPTSIICENKIINDPMSIANAFNDYFANIGANLVSTINANDNNENYKQYLTIPSNKVCIFNAITEYQVIEIIDKMENKSSSGHDSISNKIIKFCKDQISKTLTIIINQMLHSGIFPTNLKISKIIPLHKKSDVNLLSNYRPISLLPTLSKIFERVIYNQLYTYFDHNNLLNEQQYGFRSKHSTELAAIKLIDNIKYEIDQRHTPVNIYIDLSKAFDTLNFDILLYKLRYYGVTGVAFDLLKSYLTDRKQYVNLNNHKSDVLPIKTGVPQGSILSPLLFSIYINDLIFISNKFKFLMYADDTTIYFNLEDFSNDNLTNSITNELSKLNIWLSQNRLSLNADKTKYMIFHPRQKNVTPVHIAMDGKQIEIVKSFKFLGIMFDESLTWKSHVHMITNKLSKVVGIINKLKHVYPLNALTSIYNSLFVSHMNYGLLLWGTQTDDVYKIQKKAVRYITCSEYRAHSEPIFKMLDLLKIQDLFHLKILKFYYNLSYKLLPPYFNSYIDVINRESPYLYNLRATARPLIQLPRTRLVSTESSMLYQLIKLLNYTYEHNPEILKKIHEKTHSYFGFSFNVKHIYLANYKFDCTYHICYKCGRT